VKVFPSRWLHAVLLLVLAAIPASAQESPVTEPGSELEIYVMTMGVGSEIWERFGHNAIGIRDRRRGTDLVYNYGTFDFAAPDFVANFLKGRMTYWLDVADADATIRFYRERRQRSVYIQELALPPALRVELKAFLEHSRRHRRRRPSQSQVRCFPNTPRRRPLPPGRGIVGMFVSSRSLQKSWVDALALGHQSSTRTRRTGVRMLTPARSITLAAQSRRCGINSRLMNAASCGSRSH
jgi:hypothetical protein